MKKKKKPSEASMVAFQPPLGIIKKQVSASH